MRFEILHEIRYSYTAPVFFEPHTLFLRPREDSRQRLLSFELFVEPGPQLCSPFLDPFGNNPSRVWFAGASNSLLIRAESEVEIVHPNPFDYFIDRDCQRLPVSYPPEMAKPLGVYTELTGPSALVRDFSDRVASRFEGSTAYFLTGLCREIQASFRNTHRPDGAPYPAHVTLEKREGACRDLAVLFIECCRHQGLAARFTSGYYALEQSADRELHAWAEVYLEGAGWVGFDPTAGLACGETHVPVAASFDPSWVLPVSGLYRGTGVSSRMDVRVLIRRTVADKVR